MKNISGDSELFTAYHTYLQLEKSLSPRSVEAYSDDFNKLTAYLQAVGKKPEDASLDDLQEMIAELHKTGISPRSQARTVSGIKSFYRFLSLEKYILKDPTELLESPKTGLKLEIEELEIKEKEFRGNVPSKTRSTCLT